jgi:hypothetical protein
MKWYWRHHWWGFRLYYKDQYGIEVLAYCSPHPENGFVTEEQARLLVKASTIGHCEG